MAELKTALTALTAETTTRYLTGASSLSAANLTGVLPPLDGAALANVDAMTLGGATASTFGQLSGANNWTGSNVFNGMNLAPSALPGTPAPGDGDIVIDSGAGNALKWFDGGQWKSAGGGSTRQVYDSVADIDANQSEKIYVHIFNSKPTKVLLYMFGEKYNPAFYTELGEHTHTFTGNATGSASVDHTHTGPSHTHTGATGAAGTTGATGADGTGATGGQSLTHTHTTSGSNANTGLNGGALSSSLKTYNSSLTVWIDGLEKTANILTLSGLAALGDGTATHGFVTSGTGQMDITSLITWGVGQHLVEFRQAGTAGGRVRYYLYVEY